MVTVAGRADSMSYAGINDAVSLYYLQAQVRCSIVYVDA